MHIQKRLSKLASTSRSENTGWPKSNVPKVRAYCSASDHLIHKIFSGVCRDTTPSAPQMWEHCRWWLNQITDSVSLSSPLWTCIVADESTNSNVSFLFPHSPRTLSVLTFHIHVTTCVFTNSFSPQDCLL